jgi:hypothetical protein
LFDMEKEEHVGTLSVVCCVPGGFAFELSATRTGKARLPEIGAAMAEKFESSNRGMITLGA